MAVASPVFAGVATQDHTGVLQSIDRAAGTVVLDELGPWRGVSAITRRTIVLTSSTEVTQAKRAGGAGPAGWIGEFVEERSATQELNQGDFVTVQVRHAGPRATALKVTVVAPGEH